MFNKKALALTLAAAFGLGLTGQALAADLALGVVNLRLIRFDAPQSHELQQTLVKEFGPRQEELKNIEAEGQKLAQQIQSGTLAGEQLTNAQRQIAQLQSDFNLKARALQEDQRKRGQELEQRVNMEIQKAIDAVAQEQNLDVVIDGMAVLNLRSESLNVTDEILAKLKANYKEGSIANSPASK